MTGTKALLRILSLTAALMLLLPVAGDARHLPTSDKLELLKLLRAEKFKELDANLLEYQEEFERGETNDYQINYALSAFATTSPGVGEALDKWIAAHPKSQFALLAHAKYYKNLGVFSRGVDYISKTPKKRLQDMHVYFKRAIEDARSAIELNPKATVGYATLINISMYTGQGLNRDRLVAAALAATPKSELVRFAYLGTLHPWWGGTLEEIRAFIETSKATLPNPESGHPLDGYEHYVKGLIAVRQEEREQAVKHFNAALRFGETLSYRLARAENLFALKLGDWGRSDYERSLEMAPQSPSILSKVAKFSSMTGEVKRAFELWELSLQLDPLNPWTLSSRADALHRQERVGEALTDLDDAMVFGALEPRILFKRGRLRLQHFNDRVGARADLEKAIEISPQWPAYWYYYAEALTEGQDSEAPECHAVEAFEKFLELCRNGKSCDGEQVIVSEYFTTQRPLLYGTC